MPRYKARFIPQAWINERATEVDAPGETEWDVTAYFLSDNYTDAEREDMLENGFDYTTDTLREDSNAPAWMLEWDGPFEVDVTITD